MGIGVLILLLMFMTLTLDAGRLWLEKRNLQKVADMAALASARFTGCGGSLARVEGSAKQIAVLNGFTGLDDENPTVTLEAKHGFLTTNTKGEYVFTNETGEKDGINAAQITVGRKVPASVILGGLWGGETNLRATATATGGPPRATYNMGASLLTVDNDFTRMLNNLFAGIFQGRQADVSATGIQKLAASTVSLEGLRKAGGFDTINDLVNSSMTIGQLLTLYQKTVDNGGGDTDAIAALGQLISASKPNKASDNLNLKLSDVLSLNNDNSDALIDSNINVFDLIRTSITIAGQNAPYKVNISTGIIGISSNIQYGAIPKIAMGPGGISAETKNWCTSVKNASAVMTFGINNTQGFGALLGILSLGIINIDMQVKLSIASAQANLDYIEPIVGSAGIHFSVNTSPATLAITSAKDETKNGFMGLFSGNSRIGLEFGTAGNSITTKGSTAYKYVPTPVKTQFIPASDETSGALLGLLNSIPEARLVTGPFKIPFQDYFYDLVRDSEVKIKQFIMSTLGDLLSKTIDPLLKALGIYLGSADIMLYDIRTVPPKLVNVVDS